MSLPLPAVVSLSSRSDLDSKRTTCYLRIEFPSCSFLRLINTFYSLIPHLCCSLLHPPLRSGRESVGSLFAGVARVVPPLCSRVLWSSPLTHTQTHTLGCRSEACHQGHTNIPINILCHTSYLVFRFGLLHCTLEFRL